MHGETLKFVRLVIKVRVCFQKFHKTVSPHNDFSMHCPFWTWIAWGSELWTNN